MRENIRYIYDRYNLGIREVLESDIDRIRTCDPKLGIDFKSIALTTRPRCPISNLI